MEYLVYRYGANTLNQPMRHQLPLCVVAAGSRAEALKVAESYHQLYHNQFLEAVPVSRAKRKHLDEVFVKSCWRYNSAKQHPQIIATVEPLPSDCSV
jgi:hypothetical protein